MREFLWKRSRSTLTLGKDVREGGDIGSERRVRKYWWRDATYFRLLLGSILCQMESCRGNEKQMLEERTVAFVEAQELGPGEIKRTWLGEAEDTAQRRLDV